MSESNTRSMILETMARANYEFATGGMDWETGTIPTKIKMVEFAKAALTALEASGMAVVLKQGQPFDDEDDDFDICEVCEKKLRDGDLVHACSDGPTFCEDHAPTWSDIRREYDEAKAAGEFVDLFFDPEDAAVSDRVVNERIEAGHGDKKHVWPR